MNAPPTTPPISIHTCPICGQNSSTMTFYHLAICCPGLPFDPKNKVLDFRQLGTPAFPKYDLNAFQILIMKNKSLLPAELGFNEGTYTTDPIPYISRCLEILKKDQVLDKAMEVAKIKREKAYVDQQQFSGAKKLTEIQQLLCHCNYPEEDTSPSGRCFIPILLVRRAVLLVKKLPQFGINFNLILDDLLLVEKWLEFFPTSEQHSLYYMKTLCQMKLKLYKDAKVSWDKSMEALEFSNLGEDERKVRLVKLQKGLESIQENKCLNKRIPELQIADMWCLTSTNPKYPGLSGKLEIVCRNPKGGNNKQVTMATGQSRGIFAKKNIEARETLAVEEPILASLRHDLIHVALTHCHHCLKRTCHLLPCPSCCLVMFCSLKCRDASLGSYHKFECPLGFSLLAAAFGVHFQEQICLTLRLLFAHPPQYWVDKEGTYEYLKKRDYSKLNNSDGYAEDAKWRYYWDLEYQSAMSPVHDQEKWLKWIQCSFEEAVLNAVYALKLVRSSGYLKQQEDTTTTTNNNNKQQTEDVITKVIAHSVRTNRFNSMVMSNMQEEAEDGNYNGHYAMGVYNMVSLFNQNTTDDTVRLNVKGKAVVCSKKSYRKGEEIFMSSLLGIL